MANARYTKAAMIKAIRGARGMISIAAKKLGCSRRTVHSYIERYPDVAEAVQECRDLVTDTAETKLYDAIEAHEPWAIRFYLQTIGKERGYVERQQVQHSGGVEVINAEDARNKLLDHLAKVATADRTSTAGADE